MKLLVLFAFLAFFLTPSLKCELVQGHSISSANSGNPDWSQDLGLPLELAAVATYAALRTDSTEDDDSDLTDYDANTLPPENNETVVFTALSNRVRFHLYTRKNRNLGEGQELLVGSDFLIESSNYIPDAPLKMYLHGFSKNAVGSHSQRIKDEYLKGQDPVNVILVDWTRLAKIPWYGRAAANAKIVGETTGQMILYLEYKKLLKLEDVHIVGHSLGAHAAGFAGRFIGNGRVGRITALDPAAPHFVTEGEAHRVDRTDAAFVDVIHTSGGLVALRGPQGHVDFYPNGVAGQPGCGYDFWGKCSHTRANHYMLESINNPEAFKAWQCRNLYSFENGKCLNNATTHMGEHVSENAGGTYFLKTNARSPFSL